MTPVFKPVGDRALLIELGDAVDDAINRQVIALDKKIASGAIVGVLETVPAMVNVLVVFDPLKTDHHKVRDAIEDMFPIEESKGSSGQHHIIDVCYDLELGADLVAAAEALSMSVDDLIKAHSGARYRLSMFGFAPGYGYLSGVPTGIQLPRKTSAVRDVPKGSVMIAGAQCIITTLQMPAGWWVLGQSSVEIITGNDDKPFLFDVGDTVSFRPVSRNAFEKGRS